MTKKYSTKRAFISSLLILALCLTSFIGTTFAWFTDSVTSTSNIIKSGTLDVEMYWADGTTAVDTAVWTDASTGAIFDYDNWEPGYVQVRHIRIANEGTLALKYKVNIIANGEVSDLADVIDVYYADPATQVSSRTQLADANKIGTLTDALANLGASGNGTLEAGQADTITIAFKMQETAGNEYQNKSIGSDFAVQLLATQLTSEVDSFDKNYDEESVYEYIAEDVIGGGETLVADNVTVTLPASSVEDVYTLKVGNKKVETNASNETTVSLDISLFKNNQKVDAVNGVEYLVTIEVGKNLVISGLTHNGNAISGYTYDPTTGIITFTTDSFSPFAVTYTDDVTMISSAEEFIAALNEIKTVAKQMIPGENGNKQYRENAIFVLENDIVIDGNTEFMYTDSNGAPLHFYGVKGILDLNGHSITVAEDALLNGKAHANAVLLIQYSNIDIIGEGSIIASNKSIPVYGWANSTVNIYGGNYVTNASERNESAVYVNNPTVLINVYGGTYTNSEYAFNVHDNCGTTTTIILHDGITYADFLKNGTTDVIASDVRNGRIAVADDCELQENEALNKVVKK